MALFRMQQNIQFMFVSKCLHDRAPSLPLKLTMQDRGVTAALGRRGHLWDTWYAAIQKPFFPFLTSQIHTQMIKTAVSCVDERSQ